MVESKEEETKASTESSPAEKEITYNAKWPGYLGIMLSSLVNFASVADVSVDNLYKIKLKGENAEAMFGAVTFFITILILAFDRINFLQRKFDFKEIYDGKLEGSVLVCLMIWWVVGVGIMTKAGGIAYNVLNTYFSCWYTLGATIWTLDKWSAAKDIISIHELTRLSSTLPYWHILFLTSVVEMGSAADVFTQFDAFEISSSTEGKKEYSIAVGALSILVAAIAILAHYKLICCCEIKPGGILEIVAGVIMCIWWMLAVAILTTDEEIASTIQGVGVYPGSNLYLSLWLGLYASVRICLEWKAIRALKQMSKVTLQRMEDGNNQQLNNDNIE